MNVVSVQIAIRNKLLIAKRDLIKEAEERKYLYMQEQEARQLLWFQLLAHHQLASLGHRTHSKAAVAEWLV